MQFFTRQIFFLVVRGTSLSFIRVVWLLMILPKNLPEVPSKLYCQGPEGTHLP